MDFGRLEKSQTNEILANESYKHQIELAEAVTGSGGHRTRNRAPNVSWVPNDATEGQTWSCKTWYLLCFVLVFFGPVFSTVPAFWIINASSMPLRIGSINLCFNRDSQWGDCLESQKRLRILGIS